MCRHKSILYKYLCDFLGLKCRIVIGYFNNGVTTPGPHMWNVVLASDSKKYLIDVFHDPFTLVSGKSSKIKNYTRKKNCLGSTHGKYGGSSVQD
jgi:transglutaminase/protease-like cytokinesis protein 3